MTNDLGVWTADDCALVLIDYQAVQATGRRRLIIGGLHTEICLTFATVQALKDGYDVLYVAEAEKRAASAHGGH
jgi:isochorismate hydrolase